MSSGNDSYEPPQDNSYVRKDEAVQPDGAPVDDPIDEETADSDAQLARDEESAIDKDNIMKDRTRHAKPEGGNYREPADDEGIPTDDGTSSM